MVLLCWTKWSPELKLEKTFKRHLRGQWQDFKIISHQYSSYAPLPKLLKWFCSAEQNGCQSQKYKRNPLKDRISRWTKWLLKKYLNFFFLLMAFWKCQHFNLESKISQKLFKPLPSYKSIGKMLHAICISITKTCLLKYTENFTTKKWKKKSDKNSDIFHISAQNIDYGHLLEPPRLSMFLRRNKKIMYTPVNSSFTI